MTENIAIAVITGGFVVASAVVSGVFSYASGLKNRDKLEIDLECHPYFNRVESIKNEIMRTFTLPNKGKEVVFKDILFRQLDIFQKRNMELVEEVSRNHERYENNIELYNVHIETLDTVLSELYTFYKLDGGYSSEERMVLDIVMMKYSKWSQEKMHTMQEQIMLTCNSPFYVNSSPIVKTSIILDQYLSLTIGLVNSASATLNRINGDLKGLEFRGVII